MRSASPKASEAIYSFRLRLDKDSRDYVTAHVFRDAAALRRYATLAIPQRRAAHWLNTEGLAHTWSIQGAALLCGIARVA